MLVHPTLGSFPHLASWTENWPSCLISQNCITCLILIRWSLENMQDQGLFKNQDNLEAYNHHYHSHPYHHTYAHTIQTWLYYLMDQNYTNIPAVIILSSFSNWQNPRSVHGTATAVTKGSSHLHTTASLFGTWIPKRSFWFG